MPNFALAESNPPLFVLLALLSGAAVGGIVWTITGIWVRHATRRFREEHKKRTGHYPRYP